MSRLKKWVETVDEHSLTLLLRYAGEFGAISSLINLETGAYPLPRTEIDAIWQLRMHGAVLGIALVYGCEFALENTAARGAEPVFTADYREALAADKRTVWARDLDAAAYETLMWNIGEFGFRSLAQNREKYAIPKFTDHPRYDWFLRLALYNIARIFETCIQNLYK
ncbi:MAG: hypothetical protein WAK95_02315 [Desulfobacterales bacterium]